MWSRIGKKKKTRSKISGSSSILDLKKNITYYRMRKMFTCPLRRLSAWPSCKNTEWERAPRSSAKFPQCNFWDFYSVAQDPALHSRNSFLCRIFLLLADLRYLAAQPGCLLGHFNVWATEHAQPMAAFLAVLGSVLHLNQREPEWLTHL